MNARPSYAKRATASLENSDHQRGEILSFGDRNEDREPGILPTSRDRRQPRRLDPENGQNLTNQEEPRYSLSHHEDRGVNVSVNNNGVYFRSVREELQLSAYRSFGNFFAWPFRLVGRLFESALGAIMGLLGFVLKILIIPTVLLLGISIYQASENRTASETAAVVGKEGVGIIGGLLSGVWDGVFGSEEPEAPETTEAPAN